MNRYPSKKQHTRGPWKLAVADAIKSEHGITYHEIYGANNTVVARRVINSSDASLIVAAPELLEKLEEILLVDSHKGGGHSDLFYDDPGYRKELEALVAKAKGKK